jgi:peptide subunit release factor 1 (eRF1)
VTPQTLQRPLEPRLATSVGPLLDRLTGLSPGRHWILSCYVRLEPEDRVRYRYLATWRTRVKELEDGPLPSLSRDDRLSVQRDLARIRGYLAHLRNLPHARGLAIFACEALDLLEAVPLPNVHRTRVILDDTPWIAELVAAGHETKPVIVVVLDRALARFFTVSPTGAVEWPCGFSASGPGGKYHADRRDAPGTGERDYHGRLAEERHRHYALIADRLEELVRTQPIGGVVLGGPTDHTAALLRFLPEEMGGRVLGTARLNPSAVTPAIVQTAALRVAAAHERKALEAEVHTLEESIGTGWAVEGARDTLKALARRQVRVLYAREDLARGGFRCTATGRLVLARGDCAGEGDPLPIRDLVDEAIEDALRQRARVVVFPRNTPAEPVDGLAATLRFR